MSAKTELRRGYTQPAARSGINTRFVVGGILIAVIVAYLGFWAVTANSAYYMSVPEVMDHAITSTISRTIITHGSTQIMVLSMLLFGGHALHYFALALTIGICFGIYSSVFVAAALAMWLGVKREDLIKPVKEKDETDGAVV